MMFAAAMEMVNVVSAQTGGAPRHPKEAAESERDYPEKGQAAPGAAAAGGGGGGGSRLRAAPEEPPHPPVHGEPARGVLGRSSGRGKGGKLWRERCARTRPHTALPAAHRTRRAISSLWESLSGSFSPGLLLPKTIRDIVRGGESRQFGAFAKRWKRGKSPALKQSLVSAFPGLVLINNTPQLQGLRECQAFPHPQ